MLFKSLAFEKKSVHGEILKKMKLEKSEKTFSSEKITINKDSLKNLLILGQVNFSIFPFIYFRYGKKLLLQWTLFHGH